jgi:hypothetical protein
MRRPSSRYPKTRWANHSWTATRSASTVNGDPPGRTRVRGGQMIGDTVLLRADNRRGVGTIVDTDAVRYKVCWRNEKASCEVMQS